MRSRCCRPDCERSGAGATQQGAQATSCAPCQLAIRVYACLSHLIHVYPCLFLMFLMSSGMFFFMCLSCQSHPSVDSTLINVTQPDKTGSSETPQELTTGVIVGTRSLVAWSGCHCHLLSLLLSHCQHRDLQKDHRR